MSYSNVYYKESLTVFAYSIARITGVQIESDLFDSEEKMENFINEGKSILSISQFFYEAGRTCEFILNKANKQDDYDKYKAYIEGLYQFESFIGLISK